VRVSVANGDYPPGYVIAQSPCAGCLAPGASTVTLQVGTGRGTVRVPGVLGMSQAAARQTLQNAGFTVEVFLQREPSPGSEQRGGLAWKQSPAAGADAAVGSTVNVWVNPEGATTPTSNQTTTTG
jgi:serine/threonine-protein kinase